MQLSYYISFIVILPQFFGLSLNKSTGPPQLTRHVSIFGIWKTHVATFFQVDDFQPSLLRVGPLVRLRSMPFLEKQNNRGGWPVDREGEGLGLASNAWYDVCANVYNAMNLYEQWKNPGCCLGYIADQISIYTQDNDL